VSKINKIVFRRQSIGPIVWYVSFTYMYSLKMDELERRIEEMLVRKYNFVHLMIMIGCCSIICTSWKTVTLNCIKPPSPYRAVNTLRLGYNSQSVNTVQRNHLDRFSFEYFCFPCQYLSNYAPYSSLSTCCCCQKDKRGNPGSLLHSVLFENRGALDRNVLSVHFFTTVK